MKKKILILGSIFFLLFGSKNTLAQNNLIPVKVDSVLHLMTLEEKVGQLNQYTGDWDEATGPITKDGDKQNQIKQGEVGSMLNVKGVKHSRELQEMALQSRLRIPLLFGEDVIHGYKTTFPIPLAEASSWDMDAIQLSARVAATEAAGSGIHWVFAPMVDISRDPRWGRVMEGAGEDTYLGSQIAIARVKGFQGDGLGYTNSVMACVKHYAAYGAAIGGRDYNSVDMSERMLREIYLPPFKAAEKAGAATFMNSFNDLNGIPATANVHLLRDILKGEWGFKGFVVSDWGSVGEMIQHGFVKDNKEAALVAIKAGCDMDMESRSYKNNLALLVREGKVPIELVNDAVKRILLKKFELGLFDNPFKYLNTDRESREMNNPEHVKAARMVAEKSVVLLKNDKQLLPLSKNIKSIALIGPIVKTVKQNLGFWSIEWDNDSSYIVSQWKGIQNKVSSNTHLIYAKGCEINDSSHAGFAEAVQAALQADVVVMSVGEARDMTGEAKSRSNIHLPGVQEELIQAIYATGKPVVVMINAGRPLIFNWTADHIPAILYTWWLGSEAGNAIADVLFGDYNPSAKLPMSFPRTEGQIPIYYNHFNTGRPANNDNDRFYRSAYIDLSIYPKFEFGYGLSYTTFEYSNLELSKQKVRQNDTITVSLKITNTGKIAGEEIVQLYLRDKVASVVRPVKELKGFQKIYLMPGETKTVTFIIEKEKLSFYNQQMQWVAEPGEFDVMIGTSSEKIKLKSSFELLP